MKLQAWYIDKQFTLTNIDKSQFTATNTSEGGGDGV